MQRCLLSDGTHNGNGVQQAKVRDVQRFQEPLLQKVAWLDFGIVKGTQKIVTLILAHNFLFN